MTSNARGNGGCESSQQVTAEEIGCLWTLPQGGDMSAFPQQSLAELAPSGSKIPLALGPECSTQPHHFWRVQCEAEEPTSRRH